MASLVFNLMAPETRRTNSRFASCSTTPKPVYSLPQSMPITRIGPSLSKKALSIQQLAVSPAHASRRFLPSAFTLNGREDLFCRGHDDTVVLKFFRWRRNYP